MVLRVNYVDEQCLHYAVILCALCKDHVMIITGFFFFCSTFLEDCAGYA